MKDSVLLIVFLTQFAVDVHCRDIQREAPDDVCFWQSLDKCFRGGGGYGKWTCSYDSATGVSKWTMWETVTCPKDESGCECFAVGEENDVECRCYDPSPPPSFPQTGIIRWNGSENYDSDYYVSRERPRTVQVFGEVHKSANGRFLLNRTVVDKWDYDDHDQIPNVRILFEIYVPAGSGYTKYTGENGNKTCIMSHTAQTKQLSSIWSSGAYEGRSYRLSGNTWKEGSVYTQKWERLDDDPERERRWTMDVEYNSKKKYAVPIQYKFVDHDWLIGISKGQKKQFTYEPIEEDEESFQLNDFCDDL